MLPRSAAAAASCPTPAWHVLRRRQLAAPPPPPLPLPPARAHRPSSRGSPRPAPFGTALQAAFPCRPVASQDGALALGIFAGWYLNGMTIGNARTSFPQATEGNMPTSRDPLNFHRHNQLSY